MVPHVLVFFHGWFTKHMGMFPRTTKRPPHRGVVVALRSHSLAEWVSRSSNRGEGGKGEMIVGITCLEKLEGGKWVTTKWGVYTIYHNMLFTIWTPFSGVSIGIQEFIYSIKGRQHPRIVGCWWFPGLELQKFSEKFTGDASLMKAPGWHCILLMVQKSGVQPLLDSLSHYLQGFYTSQVVFRTASINSNTELFYQPNTQNHAQKCELFSAFRYEWMVNYSFKFPAVKVKPLPSLKLTDIAHDKPPFFPGKCHHKWWIFPWRITLVSG